MRRRPAVLAALAGLAAVLVAGCASSVQGTGTVAADAVKPSAAAPSGSPSATAAPGRSSLKCTGKAIAPSGAPYCFGIPGGFTDVSSSVTIDTSIGNEKFRSAVAVADRDLIIVTTYSLNADTDPISADTLEGELKTVLGQLATQGFTFESTQAERGTVDGARSFGYSATQSKNKLRSRVYFVFRGKSEVEINCQWQEKQAEVEKGCKAVLDSFQFKTVR
jgi:hypothetical protein